METLKEITELVKPAEQPAANCCESGCTCNSENPTDGCCVDCMC